MIISQLLHNFSHPTIQTHPLFFTPSEPIHLFSFHPNPLLHFHSIQTHAGLFIPSKPIYPFTFYPTQFINLHPIHTHPSIHLHSSQTHQSILTPSKHIHKGFGLEALFLLGVGVTQDPTAAITCLTLAVGFSGFAISGGWWWVGGNG